jgi:vacuolar-type H+-ATPase subunit I/STV1
LIQDKTNQLLQQFQSSIQLTDQIHQASLNAAIQKARQTFMQLSSETQQGFTSLDQTEQTRQQLTYLRQEVEGIQGNVDEARDQAAKAYRSVIGTEKEHFDLFSASIQQESYAKAYEPFQTYHMLDQLHNLLSEISANLMNYSYELENQTRDQRTTPVSPTTEYDNETDPAPNHLSP